MSEEALAVWDFTLAELEVMRVAKAPDRDPLRCYCDAVVTHRRVTDLLAKSDVLIRGQRGNVVRNPLVQMQRDAAMVIKAYAAEFGLTPRARSEFGSTGSSDGDQLEKGRYLTS